MAPGELLQVLTAAGCRLIPDGAALRVQDPQYVLTDNLRQAIRQHKAALLALCAQSDRNAAITPSTPEMCTHEERALLSPPPYSGHPMGAPFRPGQQVWLYRWDDQTPRFDAPVTIVQMRMLWPGEQDIGWCDAAGELTWHNARLAITVETQETCTPQEPSQA
jgi:hypothetical protein